MTNGRGAGMASFMTKKKKYKFQVDICLDELLEVPFVSAVLFAKLRLLDGGNFQDQSSREEVRDHTVKWNAKFSFPCKMLANASTGVLERCILRISIRKESKGGRSFNKLGFVDLNLAEYAGSGTIKKKSLLEGYDTRHRQDNSMLKFTISMNLLSGDILFKVPSPSLKHKVLNTDDQVNESRPEDFSGGSLGGSIASASSGFGSLPKKRPQLLSSELVIGHTLSESNVPVTVSSDGSGDLLQQIGLEHDEVTCETGHSRNSSNTSQLSKASGYSSINSHSRQSSSGDSGHIRGHRAVRTNTTNNTTTNLSNFVRVNSYPNRLRIPNTIIHEDCFTTPQDLLSCPPDFNYQLSNDDSEISQYFTPEKSYNSQTSCNNDSVSSSGTFKTPDDDALSMKSDIFSKKFIELRKSASETVVENLDNNQQQTTNLLEINRFSLDDAKKTQNLNNDRVVKSKSEFEIPRTTQTTTTHKNHERFFPNHFFKSDTLYSFLTPILKRRIIGGNNNNNNNESTPKNPNDSHFRIPGSPILRNPSKKQQINSCSLNSLRSTTTGNDGFLNNKVHSAGLGLLFTKRAISHRKLLDGTSGGKLAPLAISPDETPTTTTVVSSDCTQILTIRRPSVTTNPSSSSLVLSETGSLDRAKAAYERRKKTQSQDADTGGTGTRVEITRVNPDHLIAELLKSTNLEQADDSAENSGLQLFIAKDGTAALGNHEVKSQMSTGVQVFKQVVMDDNR